MTNNDRAKYYVQNRDLTSLIDEELIMLGSIFASSLIYWTCEPEYEPWEFDSEEMPVFIDLAIEYGLIRKRKSHTETVERIVFYE